ncbi:lycopene cyclase family protein [uncultured Aeromicrobium sp.]|uniref:lycopene cyclase family protein n=1 Tax=uncultured Aeromicrobium sp. TaxID=337820 RepID=UPI000B0E1B22|nr:lycopene cyclase family protein [uncultured Aeromicrobium sp.]
MSGGRVDVAVVGLGPAGRSLASACAARGLRVVAVDPRPDAVWTPTYGVWEDELAGLPATVVRSRLAAPEVRAHEAHQLSRPYVVIDNVALQAALALDDVDVRRGRLDDAEVAALSSSARVVVDARGARPQGLCADDPAPAQTAFGVVVPDDVAAPALQGAEGLLMDWRTDWRGDGGGGTAGLRPSFLYAIPLGDGTVLLEETCLAASPPLPVAELKARLLRRLAARGVDPSAVDAPLHREVVHIPMRGRGRPPVPGTLAHGVAGRGGHVVTGYSVAHALRRSRALADELATGQVPRRVDAVAPADALREAGLRAVLRLDVDGTLALFDGFGHLPAHLQRAYMARDGDLTDVAAAMWSMFRRMPWSGRRELARATLLP